jgi:hypothetical protein
VNRLHPLRPASAARLLWVCLAIVVTAAPAPATPNSGSATERAQYLFDHRHLFSGYTSAAWQVLADYRPTAPLDQSALALWCEVNVELGDDSRGKADKENYYRAAETAAETLCTFYPNDPAGHFWRAAAHGDYALAQSIPEALLALPSVMRGMERAIALDSNFVLPYAILGIVYRELPSVAGGDWTRSRRYFETGLGHAPSFTLLRLELARLDIREGLYGDARAQLDRLISTTRPYYEAAFVLNDRPAAESLLTQIRGR